MTADFDGVHLADDSFDKNAAPELKLSKPNSRNAVICYDQCGNKSSTKPGSQIRHTGVGDFHMSVNQIDDFDHTHEDLAGIYRSTPNALFSSVLVLAQTYDEFTDLFIEASALQCLTPSI